MKVVLYHLLADVIPILSGPALSEVEGSRGGGISQFESCGSN